MVGEGLSLRIGETLGLGSGRESVGEMLGLGSGTESVGEMLGLGSGTESVGEMLGLGSGRDSVGETTSFGSRRGKERLGLSLCLGEIGESFMMGVGETRGLALRLAIGSVVYLFPWNLSERKPIKDGKLVGLMLIDVIDTDG